MNDGWDFVTALSLGVFGGFIAILFYADCAQIWLPYWPFGILPILSFALAWSIFIWRHGNG